MTDRIIPPLPGPAGAELAAEAEADWAFEWDDADSAAYQARVEAFGEGGPPMTDAELAAAAELGARGPRGPSASYAEWVREGLEPEPEAEP